MANPIDFRIVTPEGRVYHDEEVEAVTIPTASGEITVLANHTPLISLLEPGELRIKKGDHTVYLAVSRGIVEVRPKSKLVILADTAERAEHIDLERAEEARKRAEEMIKEKESIDDLEFAKVQALLERNLVRIKVGNRRLTTKGK